MLDNVRSCCPGDGWCSPLSSHGRVRPVGRSRHADPPAGEWHAFEGTWTAAGPRRTLRLGHPPFDEPMPLLYPIILALAQSRRRLQAAKMRTRRRLGGYLISRLAVNRVLARLYRSGQILEVYTHWFGRIGTPSPLLLSLYAIEGVPE